MPTKLAWPNRSRTQAVKLIGFEKVEIVECNRVRAQVAVCIHKRLTKRADAGIGRINYRVGVGETDSTREPPRGRPRGMRAPFPLLLNKP